LGKAYTYLRMLLRRVVFFARVPRHCCSSFPRSFCNTQQANEEVGEGAEEATSAFPDFTGYPPGTFTKADLYDREVIGELLKNADFSGVRKLAKRGSRFAQGVLGVLSSEGKLIPRDLPDARKWLGRAADANDYDALFLYGEMLLEGKGGPKDVAQAKVYFAKAAQKGHNEAALALCDLLIEIGGSQAEAEARELMKMLASKDSVAGMLQYATLLAQGVGGPVDEAQATFWLKRAELQPEYKTLMARQGDPV